MPAGQGELKMPQPLAEFGVVTVGEVPEKLRDRVASALKKWAEVVAKTGIQL